MRGSSGSRLHNPSARINYVICRICQVITQKCGDLRIALDGNMSNRESKVRMSFLARQLIDRRDNFPPTVTTGRGDALEDSRVSGIDGPLECPHVLIETRADGLVGRRIRG